MPRLLVAAALWSVASLAAADGNRLTYLDEFCDPYYPGAATARLTTPQWIGVEGVEAAVVLSIDDLKDTARYEAFIRPIASRLKRIDGRAPISLMATVVDPGDPLLPRWQAEGVSVEAHTFHHPCPCLQAGLPYSAKETFDRNVDLLAAIPGGRSVAFRMPCCDSMNTQSPRFLVEVFGKTTPAGRFLSLDSSVFLQFTAADAANPRDAVLDGHGRNRFAPYVPHDRRFANYIDDYPYPYLIGRTCWELPSALPDDWLGFNLRGRCHAQTLADMKAALDITVAKQGLYVLTFHPHNWISQQQIIDLIDHAVSRHGRKVMFLNFGEVEERLTRNLLGGVPLRDSRGHDNGVRLFDVDGDGFIDATIANAAVRQTRVWQPQRRSWQSCAFPAAIVAAEADPADGGVRFGVLEPGGSAAAVVRSESADGLWNFRHGQWRPMAPSSGLAEAGVFTARGRRDQGVRLRDLDGDGRCELIAGGDEQSAVFSWLPAERRWRRLPFGLPGGTRIVDRAGGDAGLRFVDVDGDARGDVVFSDGTGYSVDLFAGMETGWSRRARAGRRGQPDELPMIVRQDGTNNGVWFARGQMWVQNEQTGRPPPKGRPARPEDYVTTQSIPLAELATVRGAE